MNEFLKMFLKCQLSRCFNRPNCIRNSVLISFHFIVTWFVDRFDINQSWKQILWLFFQFCEEIRSISNFSLLMKTEISHYSLNYVAKSCFHDFSGKYFNKIFSILKTSEVKIKQGKTKTSKIHLIIDNPVYDWHSSYIF